MNWLWIHLFRINCTMKSSKRTPSATASASTTIDCIKCDTWTKWSANHCGNGRQSSSLIACACRISNTATRAAYDFALRKICLFGCPSTDSITIQTTSPSHIDSIQNDSARRRRRTSSQARICHLDTDRAIASVSIFRRRRNEGIINWYCRRLICQAHVLLWWKLKLSCITCCWISPSNRVKTRRFQSNWRKRQWGSWPKTASVWISFQGNEPIEVFYIMFVGNQSNRWRNQHKPLTWILQSKSYHSIVEY